MTDMRVFGNFEGDMAFENLSFPNTYGVDRPHQSLLPI